MPGRPTARPSPSTPSIAGTSARCRSRRISATRRSSASCGAAIPGDENERRTLALVQVATEDASTDLPLEAPEPAARDQRLRWSPSGRLLVDQVSDTGAERWLFVVAPGHDRAAAGVARPPRLAHLSGLRRAVDHDGRRISSSPISTSTTSSTRSTRVAAPGRCAITPGDWDVAGERGAATVQVVPAPKACLLHRHGEEPVRTPRLPLAEGGGPAVAITSLAGVHVPVVSPDGRTLASIWSDDVTPPELLVRGTAGRRRRRAGHHVAAAGVRPLRRGPGRATQPSRNAVDGFTLHARILEPAGSRPVEKSPGDLRTGLLEHGAQPVGRRHRHAAAVPRAARLHRRPGRRARQRRLRPRASARRS